MPEIDESEYIVNIELKDQYNNIFYIDDVNNYDKSIRLKDGSPSAFFDSRRRDIFINKDIYIINNSIIQELKTIFKEYSKDDGHDSKSSSYYYSSTRTPIGSLDTIKDLMRTTKDLAKIYNIFTDSSYAKLIKDNIIHFNQTHGRTRPLTDDSTINKTILENFKYISNDNKTSNFDDEEKMDALMFNNIMYLLKNSFLKKETILINIQGEKYYVDEVLFYDLPYIHMVKKEYEVPKTLSIYLRLKTIPIIDIPALRLFYVTDDIEVKNIKISAPRELKPVDIDKDFAKYKTMYIFDTFNYADENDNINAFFNSLKNEKRVNKIQELFLNADIVNKYQTRYKEHNKNKIEALDKKDNDVKAIIKRKNVNANILYLLREKFNLYDNKILIDNVFVDDTYIAYDISNISSTETQVKYHSIMTNKKYTNYDNSKKNSVLKNIFKEYIKRTTANYIENNFFYEDKKADKRLESVVYNVLLVFKSYKQDSVKKKPSLMRRYIGEECLSNANTLDKIFSKLIYRRLGLPDKFFYDKFTNINNKNAMAIASNVIAPNVIAPNVIAPNIPNIPTIKAGGKKHRTKKYRTKKYNTKKYNTKKYNTKKHSTKKYSTKKYRVR
jgi:hypothetical protein